MDTKARISGDNFYKKLSSTKGSVNSIQGTTLSSSNFFYQQHKSDSYVTLIQMLKSDLLQIQQMINDNSSDIKMYKILSKTPGLTKKLTEIEETKNIKIYIEKINEDSNNIEKIMKIYGVSKQNELISKLFLELECSDLLLKKINDFFILMKLKKYKDDTYQDTLSKILLIKEYIENDHYGKFEIEPNKDNENCCTICFRYPDGEKRIDRRFLKTDKIKDLYEYVESLGKEIYSEDGEGVFSLYQPFPPKKYENMENTLENEGLFPNAVIQIKEE